MYNKDVKKEFMDSHKEINLATETLYGLIFNTTESYEEDLDKDISQFTIREIIDLYKSLCSVSINRLVLWNSALNTYARYCHVNNLIYDGQNHFDEVDSDILISCLNVGKINDRILTRDKLEESLKDLLNPSDRAAVLCAFEGINGKRQSELVMLDSSNIVGNTLVFPDRKLEVSELLIKELKRSINEYTYYIFSDSVSGSGVRNFDKDDPRVFKRMFNAKEENESEINLLRRIYLKFRRIEKYMESSAFSLNALRESGRIHMINELYKKEGGSLSTSEIISKYKNEIYYRYGKIQSIKKYVGVYDEYFLG